MRCGKRKVNSSLMPDLESSGLSVSMTNSQKVSAGSVAQFGACAMQEDERRWRARVGGARLGHRELLLLSVSCARSFALMRLSAVGRLRADACDGVLLHHADPFLSRLFAKCGWFVPVSVP